MSDSNVVIVSLATDSKTIVDVGPRVAPQSGQAVTDPTSTSLPRVQLKTIG